MAGGWLERGLAHYADCNWEEAGEALEHALAEQPGNADAWYRLGNVRCEQHRDPEALQCFSRLLALDGSHAQGRNNFGATSERLGRHEDAFAAYRRALESDPQLLEPYLNLGRLCESHGEFERAAAYFEAGLKRHPAHPMLVHLLAAVRGHSTARAPRDYIVAYFDRFAPGFDKHLVEKLGYHVPGALAELVRTRLEAGARVLDLGCGTGLMGKALAGCALELVGIDLSPRMLERAKERGLYAQLMLDDVGEALDRIPPASFRAAFAADVFVYIGELDRLFRRVARVLEARGLFGFSVELLQQGSYALQSTGRYAHSLEYLRGLAKQAGFRELVEQSIELRHEKGGTLTGALLLLERL
jgi:predicted TPR repeat methyltransferase